MLKKMLCFWVIGWIFLTMSAVLAAQVTLSGAVIGGANRIKRVIQGSIPPPPADAVGASWLGEHTHVLEIPLSNVNPDKCVVELQGGVNLIRLDAAGFPDSPIAYLPYQLESFTAQKVTAKTGKIPGYDVRYCKEIFEPLSYQIVEYYE